MKKAIIIALAILVIIAGSIWAFFSYPHRTEPKTVNNFIECAAAGYPIMESYPRQCRTASGQNFVEDIGNELSKADLITISNPRPNQEVSSPLTITGSARGTWYFEASFPVKLYDANNNLLAQGIAQAESDWMTENFVPFKAELSFYSTSTSGTLVLKKDNPSGLPEHDDELRLPLKFLPPAEKVKVKVFFNNSNLDPELTCNQVFPVEREVPKTPALARAALTELLAGLTPADRAAGYTTSLNTGIKIQSLTIDSGVTKVDFDEQLEARVGGSCRVAAISAQIRETLKQFASVTSVIISINGRTADILQP